MKVYEPAAKTGAATIREHGEIADRGGDPEVAAQAWTDAGFDDTMTARVAVAIRTRSPTRSPVAT
jgi:hypothetical protein